MKKPFTSPVCEEIRAEAINVICTSVGPTQNTLKFGNLNNDDKGIVLHASASDIFE